jgi:hypothetical protein
MLGISGGGVAAAYLHSSDARQQEIAASLNKIVERELRNPNRGPSKVGAAKPSGTLRARNAAKAP